MPNLLALSVLVAVLLCIAAYLRSRKKAAIALGVSMVLAAEGRFLVLGLSPDQLAALPFFVACWRPKMACCSAPPWLCA